MSHLAIIPCKRNSSRVKDKNIRDLYGLPLFVHSFQQAKESGIFSDILISTESDYIVDLASNYNIDIPFKRSDKYTHDDVTLGDYVIEALDRFKEMGKDFEFVTVLFATSPLRTPNDIISCFNMIDKDIDGSVSIVKYNYPVLHALKQDGNLVIPLYPEYTDVIEQHHPKCFADNASILMMRVEKFRKTKNFFVGNIAGYIMPSNRSVDINTEEDWEMVEFLFPKTREVTD